MSKRVLIVLVLIVAALTAFAGGQKETGKPAAGAQPAAAAAGMEKEAPMLATLVASGKLPPLDKRLPPNPVVVKAKEIGKYGGTVRSPILGPYVFYGDPQSLVGPETILRLNPDYKGISPGLASYEFQNGGKTVILHLIPGIKWSDGQPFTADDLLFWYQDIILNDELTPVKPAQWSPGGELMKMTKVDDYTVKLDFKEPYPVAIYLLAHYPGFQGGFFQPKHYLKQFHPSYVDKATLTKMAKDAGFDTWVQLFQDKARVASGIPASVGLPTVSAFMMTAVGPQTVSFERNPYFFRVDAEGRQLPYIDHVELYILQDVEMVNLKLISGELDFVGHNAQFKNLSVYKDNQAKGGYRVLSWKSAYATEAAMQFNLTDRDPVLRKIFQDVRFRRAMSLAINRKEISNSLYFGLATPWQNTLLKETTYFEPQFATAYTDFDTKTANQLLDQMGLDKKDKDGFRLRPDGKRLAFVVEYHQADEAVYLPICELVVQYWKDVGVDVSLKEISNDLQRERAMGNLMDATVWYSDKSMDHTFILYPMWYVPYNWNWETTWGTEWARWYATGGKEGETPPPAMKQLLDWWEQMKRTTDDKERLDLGRKILSYQAENLLTIGTVGEVPVPVLVNKRLHNIPETGIYGYDTIRMQPNHPETFFFGD